MTQRIDRLSSQLLSSPPVAGSEQAGDIRISICHNRHTRGQFEALLTKNAVWFVAKLCAQFSPAVATMQHDRARRALAMHYHHQLPNFNPDATARAIREGDWKIAPLPLALQDRTVDVGDVAPNETDRLVKALNSSAQGVQCDFDDGCCPTWENILQGHENLRLAVNGDLCGSTGEQVKYPCYPALMIRPRSWNMIERHMVVNGQRVPGALFDFGLHYFHNAKRLLETQRRAEQDYAVSGRLRTHLGPFCYFPKLETAKEAALWNDIMTWTECELQLPHGSMKAVVLIESISAAFEMHEILFALREHSGGLNCGMWDYVASIVCRLGSSPRFLFPDRLENVNFTSPFMKSYRQLLVHTCHVRAAPGTGGMVGDVIGEESPSARRQEIIEKIKAGKGAEAQMGADGALVFEVDLVTDMQAVFNAAVRTPASDEACARIGQHELLDIVKGRTTLKGLKSNVAVGVLFCHAWLQRRGFFIHQGAVEDSATAEISRAQVWQQIRHRVQLSDSSQHVDVPLVQMLVRDCIAVHSERGANPQVLEQAASLFMEMVTLQHPPLFMTTFLDEQLPFFGEAVEWVDVS